MYVAIRTAEGLVQDGKTLIGLGRWSRAAALGVLALEETGKIWLLVSIAEAGNDSAALKKTWREYRSHPAKSGQTLTPGPLPESEVRSQIQHGYGMDFDRLKQLALYSNLLTDDRWVVPELVVTRRHAEFVLALAGAMVGQALELYKKDQAGKS